MGGVAVGQPELLFEGRSDCGMVVVRSHGRARYRAEPADSLQTA